jgi:uncharacterized membrane protein
VEATPTEAPAAEATATSTEAPTDVPPTPTGTATLLAASPTAEQVEAREEPSATASPTEAAQPRTDGGGVSPCLLAGMGLVAVGVLVLVLSRWRR